MIWRNFLRRTLSALFIASIMLCNAAHAEIYTAMGEYIMSEGENLGIAKERAKKDAMRLACEQAGVYVKSYSRMKNFSLEADVIETMTANIIKLVVEPDYKSEIVGNLEGYRIIATITAQIDDSDINRWLNKDSQQISELVAQMEALRKANAEQERQIAKLKRQLKANPQDKEEIIKKFAEADKNFLSNQKVDEGWKLWDKKDYNGALNLFNEAIELNPNNSEAWRGRGTAYLGLKQHEQAILDLNKSIELNLQFSATYYNRGIAYKELKQYERAILDFNKAIELNSQYINAYYNRGWVYGELKQYKRAISDYTKAIELNPNNADAYNNRGWYYYCLKQYKRAVKDFDKVLELNPNYTRAKNNRELCLKAMGK